VVTLLLGVGFAPAQDVLTEGRPADVGLSAAALGEAVAPYRKAVERDELRGAVLLVARKGKVVLHEAVGWRDYDKRLPMEKDTLFHVASNTKAVVAAGVLMLADEGKLSLDDPVGHYLPAFANDRCRAITVRQLLTHTSGLRIPTIFLEPLTLKTLRGEVDRFAPIGPLEKPGTSYSYNNPGYNMLGALTEVVSGKPLETFLTERIYRPLGMEDTANHDLPDRVRRRSCIYRRKGDGWKVDYRPGDRPTYPFVRGSGGMITTAGDYARFLQMVLNAGRYAGQQLLRPETARAATSPQTRSLYNTLEQLVVADFYSYGWAVSMEGPYWHGGSDGTFVWTDPRHEVFAIAFTQSTGGRDLSRDFMWRVRQAAEGMP
jgi:CubicO group peptidase (beta-lactamase class C family)